MSQSYLYVHDPKPPFPRIHGPIPFQSLSRTNELSVDSDARFTVSWADTQPNWLQPGACWMIDDSDIGEEPWAGFVGPQPLPFKATDIAVQLMGPKKALLSVELALAFPKFIGRGMAIQEVLTAAQQINCGMFPGEIETQGPALNLDIRAETASAFIDAIKEASGFDYRERCVADERGRLAFYLDFGELRRPTDIVFTANDIVAGVYILERPLSSLTAVGAGPTFDLRRGATIASSHSKVIGSPVDQPIIAEEVYNNFVSVRDIGPASTRHATIVRERLGEKDMAELAREKYREMLEGVDAIALTVDATRQAGRKLRLGDVVNLNIVDWNDGVDVVARVHVTRIEPQASAGQKDIIAKVLP